jgi:hypothetical protein
VGVAQDSGDGHWHAQGITAGFSADAAPAIFTLVEGHSNFQGIGRSAASVGEMLRQKIEVALTVIRVQPLAPETELVGHLCLDRQGPRPPQCTAGIWLCGSAELQFPEQVTGPLGCEFPANFQLLQLGVALGEPRDDLLQISGQVFHSRLQIPPLAEQALHARLDSPQQRIGRRDRYAIGVGPIQPVGE